MSASQLEIAFSASLLFIPLNSPELIMIPSSVDASFRFSGLKFFAFAGLITSLRGISYFLANLKSRLSCASHITAPVP